MSANVPAAEAVSAPLFDDAFLVDKAAEYLEAVGKYEVATCLRREAGGQRDSTTVAVLGEVGRGKSLLVEALTTEDPGGVETLRDTSYIDCPGFNGADSEITKAALALTRRAGVVVFVLDSTTTITEQECSVLGEISQGAAGFVVAIAKKDKNLLGWREVAAENRRQIGLKVGMDVSVVSVSALRYLSGVKGSHELVDVVVQESGIPALRREIGKVRAQLERSKFEVVLRQAMLLLNAELEIVNAELARETSRKIDELEVHKQQLEMLTTNRRRGQQLLSAGLTQARNRAIEVLEADLARAREKWHSYFEKTAPRYVREQREAVFFQIESEFSGIFETAIRRFMRAAREAYTEVNDGVVEWHTVVDALAETARETAVDYPPQQIGSVGKVIDPSLVSLTIAGGFSLTHVIGFVPGVGTAIVGSGGAALPFVAMAGLWLGVNMYHRSVKTNRAEMMKWLDQLVLNARRQITHSVDSVYNELRPIVVNQFNDDLEIRLRETKGQIQRLKSQHRMSLAEADAEITEARKKASYLNRLMGQIRERVEQYE